MRSTISSDTGVRHKHKYENKNKFHQYFLNNFFKNIEELLLKENYKNVLDFATGEGLFLEKLLSTTKISFDNVTGIDLREDAINEAKAKLPKFSFLVQDLLTWDIEPKTFELVIASQVLEHLHEPERFLKKIAELSSKHVLLSVPHEPWFCLMNLIRGRDLKRFGNHPEHINHWSVRNFVKFVEKELKIIKVNKSFPFIIVLAEVDK